MELDVHLERSNEEKWGFDIAGNPEQNLPLTVIKISQDTPAEKAGLKCDDVIIKIGEKLVADLSHEEALQAIDDAKEALFLRVTRGLYEPVVENPEDPFEKYEQPDSDQPSEPTEVPFKIEQFIEPPSLDPTPGPSPVEPSLVGSNPRGPTPFTPLGAEFLDSRSVTASPQRQFRPFSTEPLPEIPPLEDPILLNPNYKDNFPKPSEGMDVFTKSGEEEVDIPAETKFKLPVSVQYDPEGKKQKVVEKKDDIIERKVIKEVSNDVLQYIKEREKKEEELRKQRETKKKVKKIKEVKKTEEVKKDNILIKAKEETAKKEAKKFMEEVLQEIEFKKMEEAALNLVEESIQKAVTTTEEIKMETKEEIIKTSKVVTEKLEKETESKGIQVNEMQDQKNMKELVDKTAGNVSKIPIVTFTEEESHQSYEKKVREEKMYPNVLEDIQEEKEEAAEETKHEEVDSEIIKEEIQETEEIIIKEKKEEIIKEVSTKEVTTNVEEKVIESNVKEEKVTEESMENVQEEQKETTLVEETQVVSKPDSEDNETKFESFENETKEERRVSFTEEEVIKPIKTLMDESKTESILIKEEHTESIKNNKEEQNVSSAEEAQKEIIPNVSVVEEETKFEKFEKHVREEKYVNTVEEVEEEKEEEIARKNSDSKPEMIVEQIKEIELSKKVLEQEKVISTDTINPEPVAEKQIDKPGYSVKEEQKFESFEKGKDKVEKVSAASKESKELTSTDDSKIERAEKQEVKQTAVVQKYEENGTETIPQTVTKFDKKEFESVNIRKESVVFDKKIETKPVVVEKDIKEPKIEEQREEFIKAKEEKERVYTEKKVTGDFKSAAERRVYTLGLQTIPNIKGVVHSYHFNLLLKTFFIHLTDVMVALSRFILTQPAFSLEDSEKRRETVEKSMMESTLKEYVRVEQERRDREVIEDSIQKEVNRRVEQKLQEEAYEREEMKRAEMRIAEERQKKELEQKRQQEMQRMKEVLKEEVKEERRMESAYREEKMSVEKREPKQPPPTTRFAGYQASESRRMETRQETRSLRTIRPGRQTYRAVVEAHVYTNPDVIFEDHSDEMTELEIQELEMRQSLEIKRREEERLEMIRREEERKEMQRREQQRIEMERQRRLEIQRQEQMRIQRERMEMKRREEQMLEMRKREELTRSFEQQQYSRNDLLHDAVQKVEDFIETKRLLEQALSMQQSSQAVVQQTRKVILPPPLPPAPLYRAVVAPQQQIKREMKRTEIVDKTIHKTFDAKKYVQRVPKPRMEEKAVQVCQKQVTDVKREAVEVIKSLVDQRAALEVLQVQSTKDMTRELKVQKQKKVEASRSVVAQKAVQVTKVETARDELSELKISKQKAKEVVKSLVDQKAALEIVQVQAVKDEVKELKVKKEQRYDASKSIIQQKGAVQVTQVQTAKDELSELKVSKQEAKEVVKSLVEQKAALEVLEVQTTKDEISKLEIKKEKKVDASRSVIAQKAIEVQSVETRKDEIQELKLSKKKTVDVSQKIIEQTAAIEVAEVQPAKDEIKELQVTKAKSVDVSQSLIEQKAIQVSEVKTTADEIRELEISKQKAVDASEKLIEQRAAIEISEVEADKDEISELEITKQKAVDASKSIIAQTAAIEIAEVETAKDEIDELKIDMQKTAEISQSLIEQTAALQVAKVETSIDELSELEISKQKAVAVSETIIEQAPALEVLKVEAEVDELAQLEIEEAKSIDVKESIESVRATAAIVTQVEPVVGDLAELEIKAEREAELAKTTEVPEVKEKAKVLRKPPTILDEFAELKIVKYDVQEPEGVDIVEVIDESEEAVQITEMRESAVDITEIELEHKATRQAAVEITEIESERKAKRQSAVEITELESEHKEIAEMSMHEQKVQIAQSVEVEQKRGEALKIGGVSVTSSKDESAGLTIIKHQELEIDHPQEMEVEVSEEKSFSSQEIHQTGSIEQQASFTARSAQISEEVKIVGGKSEPSTPSTPSTHPPSPLTDEYMFSLSIPLPKSRGTTPIPPEIPKVVKKEDPNIVKKDLHVVNEEDPHIVKKSLVPHIEAVVESPIVYDPPLPTPPSSPVSKSSSPKYTKPGLKGGAEFGRFLREEIREMKRKSSLLASAIDETIKSIEEYKEEVGIETKKHTKEDKHITKTITETTTIVENGEVKETKVTERTETVTENGRNKIEEVTSNGDVEETKVTEKRDSISNTEGKVEEVIDNIINGEPKVEEIKVEEIKEESSTEESKVVITENGNVKQNGAVTEETTALVDEPGSVEIVEVKEEITEIKEEIKKVKEVTEIKQITEVIDTDKVEENEEKSEEIKFQKTETIEVKTTSEEPVTTAIEAIKDEVDKEVQKIIEKTEEKKETVETKKDNTEQKHKKPDSVEVREFKKTEVSEEKIDYLKLVKPVKFDPEEARSQRSTPAPPVQETPEPSDGRESKMYMSETGELLGTIQGIVDGLEEAVVDEEVAKALGKPGMPKEKISEIISGEADMLREAHVMGLSRVLSSHMHRVDENIEEAQPIKPLVPSLKDSEVIRALNEEIKMEEERKRQKEEKRWTTFLQKPKRPVPRAKFGYYGYIEPEQEEIKEPYKVKIVKQPKPKVAPDYKPEDFDTGPLPWEQRAEIEASLPPIEPEDPILVPEEGPEFLEAVDPLPESAVPDLEDTGIPLPAEEPPQLPEIQLTEDTPVQKYAPVHFEVTPVEPVEPTVEPGEPAPAEMRDMDENQLAEQLTRSVQSMVDPNAPLEQQLAQMRAQLAALAQLPGVIQQTLELVTKQLLQFTHQGMQQMQNQIDNRVKAQQSYERYEEIQIQQQREQQYENYQQQIENQQLMEQNQIEQIEAEQQQLMQQQEQQVQQPEKILSPEEIEALRREEEARMEEERKAEKQRKEQMQFDQERRSQQATPRPNKPKPKFGPLDPEERRLVATGRPIRFRKDMYDEKLIAETIQAQSELIQGKVLGFSSEKDARYIERINFMKYEKPEPSLDHLKNSEVYKVVHNMDDRPLKRVELLTPVIAESDYRKRCRSRTPGGRLDNRSPIPQQLHP